MVNHDAGDCPDCSVDAMVAALLAVPAVVGLAALVGWVLG